MIEQTFYRFFWCIPLFGLQNQKDQELGKKTFMNEFPLTFNVRERKICHFL